MGSQGSSGKGVFGSLIDIISFVFKIQGAVGLTLLMVLLMNISAGVESWQQGTLAPFARKVGGEILNHDNKLYQEGLQIEKNGGLLQLHDGKVGVWQKIKHAFNFIKSLGGVLLNIWYLYVFGLIFYKFSGWVITNNESAVGSNLIFAVIAVVMLQVFANFVVVDTSISNNPSSTAEKFVPLRGLFKFVSVSPLIFNPVYERYTGEPFATVDGDSLPENITIVENETPSVVNSLSML